MWLTESKKELAFPTEMKSKMKRKGMNSRRIEAVMTQEKEGSFSETDFDLT